MPDPRFYFLFVPLGLLYLASAFFTSLTFRSLFCVTIMLFGLAEAFFGIRDGRCFHNTLITREREPANFWLVVVLALMLVIAGAAILWQEVFFAFAGGRPARAAG